MVIIMCWGLYRGKGRGGEGEDERYLLYILFYWFFFSAIVVLLLSGILGFGSLGLGVNSVSVLRVTISAVGTCSCLFIIGCSAGTRWTYAICHSYIREEGGWGRNDGGRDGRGSALVFAVHTMMVLQT
ncbi:hypothetical protein BZA05DRAFT_80004 [Tricharina praecox]|uniref:uncharacterized protein n=1 Tax=Tricharina praecox TaxID=43433 RepID=UPI0022207556|nr:uncharacterized protein BZA05DRAFT_80004 [Tricharina praecox]KAI5848989.1 hypothetical protein BZA05DRAFT_80004 [Tricharina praecox]